MTQLSALIFDVDGTIAETERDGHRVAFNLAFKEAGLNWNWTESLYGELLEIAGGKERIKYYIDQYKPEIPDNLDLVQFIPQLHSHKTQYYQKLLSENPIELRPGIKRIFEEARSQKIRLAIATTAALPNVLALLEHSLAPESVNWFEVIAAGDIVAKKKPAPDIYVYVLEKMGLSPQDCLVIEDSPQGLQSASQAGLNTVITVNNYTKNLDFGGTNLILNHLGEPEDPLEIVGGKLAEQFTNYSYFNLNFAQKFLEYSCQKLY